MPRNLTRPPVAKIAKTIGKDRGVKNQRSLVKLLAGSLTLTLLAGMGVFIVGGVLATRQATSHSTAGRIGTVTRTKAVDGSVQGIRTVDLTSAINVRDGRLVGTGDFKARLASNQTYLEFHTEGQPYSIKTVVAGFKKVAGQAQREIITFPGVTAGTNLSQKLYVGKLKEEIKLLTSKASSTFRFTISSSDNLVLKKSGNNIAFFRSTDNKELVKIEQPYAVDAKGVKYHFRYELKGRTLTLKPASSLAGAVYPLVIDPSYTIVAGALTDSTAWNNQRRLTRTSNGDLHSVYYRTSTSHSNIFYAKSTDGGQLWTETNLTNDGTYNQQYPSIAVDSSNNLHVVWEGTDAASPSNAQIRYKKYTVGTGWDASPTDLSADSGYIQHYPTIAVDSSDNLHVIWCGGPGSFPSQVRYKKYTVGTGWGAVTNLTSDTVDQLFAALAVDSSNNLHVAWYAFTAPNYRIRYIKYTVGTGWGAVTDLTTESYDQIIPSVAVDSSNNVHVVWEGNNSTTPYVTQIRYKKYTAGTGWGAIVNLTSDATYNQDRPTIAVDASDNLQVVWHGNYTAAPTYSQIRYLKYTVGTGWGAITNLTSSASTNQQFPNLIWARWPVVGGYSSCRPKTGYAFTWTDGTTVKYYCSSNLTFDANNPAPPDVSLLAYGSVTAGSVAQKYRTFGFGDDWGAATNTPDTTHTTNWTVLKASPTNPGAYVMAEVTTEASNNFKVYSYYNGTWTSEFTGTQSAGQAMYRCFDVAFENTSGHVLVAYAKSTGAATQVYYREGTWNGSSFGLSGVADSSFTFNTSYLSGNLRWLVLANKINSDQMILTAVSDSGSGNNITAAIWDGSAFGTQNTTGWGLCGWLSATAPTNWDFDCAYETNSGDGMVAWGFYGTPYWKYVRYTGGAWGSVTNGPTTNLTYSIRVLSLAADPRPTSNLIAAGITEASTANHVNGVVWNGSTPAWTGPTSLDTSVYGTATGRQVDVCYAGTTGNAILVYDDVTSLTNLDWARSVNGAAFSLQTPFTESGSRDNNIQLVSDATTGRIMFTRLDANSDLYAYYYVDGTGWTATNSGAALETDSSGGTTKESYMFAFENVYRVPTLGWWLLAVLVIGFSFVAVRRGALKLRKEKA